MNKKQLLTIKIEDLLSTIGPVKSVENVIKIELKKIATKSKKLLYFVNNVTIIIVINNINKANVYFNKNDILYINNNNHYELLRIVCSLNPSFLEKTVDILFIEDRKFDSKTHELFSYIIDYPQYLVGVKTKHVNFENNFSNAKLSDYILHARKSIVNSLFAKDNRTPYRISKYNEIVPTQEDADLKYKYINLRCPVCANKFEITKETIHNVIEIKVKTKKIVFNCLHKGKEQFEEKFYISLDKYKEYISSSATIYTLQMWFIDNFKRLTDEN